MFGRSGSFGLKSPEEGLAAPGILPAFPSCYNLINGNRCKYTVKLQEDTVLSSGLSSVRKETSWRKSMAVLMDFSNSCSDSTVCGCRAHWHRR